MVAWITGELQKIGRGPIAGSEAFPDHGNRIDPDALFNGEHTGPSYTTSRLWRISPPIYQSFASNLEMARQLNAPLQPAGAGGIGDYFQLYAAETTLKPTDA